MIFLSNGCSFTWGGGIRSGLLDSEGEFFDYMSNDEARTHLKNLVYPGIISKRINAEDVNLSLGCGSNARILRTTVDWVYKNLDRIKNEKVLAFIQWAHPHRFEIYDDTTDRWAVCKDGVFIFPNYTDTTPFRDYYEARLTQVTKYQLAFEWLMQMLTLHLLFTSLNIPYRFARNGYYDLLGVLKPEEMEIYKTFNILDLDVPGDCEKGESGHATKRGHMQLADLIIDMWVKDHV